MIDAARRAGSALESLAFLAARCCPSLRVLAGCAGTTGSWAKNALARRRPDLDAKKLAPGGVASRILLPGKSLSGKLFSLNSSTIENYMVKGHELMWKFSWESFVDAFFSFFSFDFKRQSIYFLES